MVGTIAGFRRYHPPMRYGICLPNFTDLASPEAIEAAASAAERLGWEAVWTTDHVLVDRSDEAADYFTNYDAILTLAWVGARHPGLKLGTSVIVVPQRNAVILAKELASLDSLSGGRLIAGVGVGWNRKEFANLDAADRFHVRGAYLSETIRLWRHLWSGSTEPFVGRFHPLQDFVFHPLPPQGGSLPIVIGGRSEPALKRAGALADGYHSSSTSPESYAKRLPIIKAAAEEAGRPMPELSARVDVDFASRTDGFYAMRGSAEDVAAEVRKFAELGVEQLALSFDAPTLAGFIEGVERFAAEVTPLT
jgi:probable F420-dependent oxidoreductase